MERVKTRSGILQVKRGKNSETHPVHPQKGQNRVRSVFWGAEGCTREQGRPSATQPPPQISKQVVLVWCCEVFLQARVGRKSPESLNNST